MLLSVCCLCTCLNFWNFSNLVVFHNFHLLSNILNLKFNIRVWYTNVNVVRANRRIWKKSPTVNFISISFHFHKIQYSYFLNMVFDVFQIKQLFFSTCIQYSAINKIKMFFTLVQSHQIFRHSDVKTSKSVKVKFSK